MSRRPRGPKRHMTSWSTDHLFGSRQAHNFSRTSSNRGREPGERNNVSRERAVWEGEPQSRRDSLTMPPRIHLRGASRLLTIRSRPIMPFQQPSLGALARGLSTETSNTIQPGPSDLLPPSSLQAGKSANLTQAPVVTDPAAAENAEALRQLELMSHGLNPFDPEYDGHKFHMTRTPWEKQMHLKDRYDPLITQLTKLLMWDGKLSKAQRVRFIPRDIRHMRG